jgi:hypothetical protein
MAEARAAARQAKEDEKARRYLEREEKKMNRQIARDAVEYERRKAREERGRLASRTPQPQSMNRPGRSASRPRIDPEDLVAAAAAALEPKPKARAKATVAEVTAMATEKFRGRAKAKATVAEVTAMATEKFRGRAKAKKDTIRRIPVVKDAKRAGRLKGAAITAQ